MTEDTTSLAARRRFLSKLGSVVTCAGAVVGAGALGAVQNVAAKSEPSAASDSPQIKDYDWTKHRWGYGVDATKCIGCLRCVEACKRENDVPGDAHHFRTWVERYVYLENGLDATVDSQADPVNIAA